MNGFLVRTFQSENCQVSPQQNAYFELSCKIQFNSNPSSSASTDVISAVYSGDLHHTSSAATFSIVVNPPCHDNGQGNCNGNGNQPHVIAGNLFGMLGASVSFLTTSASNLGAAFAVSVIGATVAVPLVSQRSKIGTYFHKTG